ncbi:nitrogen permease regulator of amino acid transport activity 3-domain-containing protein [Xylaria arbuscula]|nr:nitrogen permease regulator of amino acid transport activity 3-domain-containing protein [Xylaria arbuscula]
MASTPVLPNPSNLLGVALVVNRSRDGPRFVFHYPPRIQYDKKQRTVPSRGSVEDELDDEDDDALLNELFQLAPFEGTSGSLSNMPGLQSWNHDDHIETETGSHIVPWEHVAGYPTRDLESLLTPSRAFHKRLFQVSLDQLCLVSSPVYVHESGVWRKKKRQPKSKPPKSPENGAESAASRDGQPSAMLAPDVPVNDSDDLLTADDATSPNIGNGVGVDETEEKKSGMTMFNLVFILKPKKHEAKELAETLYTHIIKKINKLFKYSQQKTDFVWKESKRILTLKDKNREEKIKMSVLWKEILDVSSLAACVQDIYEAVSQNKIAALQLETPEGTIAHSVQISVPFYLTDLPPEEEAESTRGLWITTANYFVEEDSLHDPSFLDKNFGLLLMSDEKKIIAELQADADEATAAMVEFVRLSKPTMSFHQISQGSGLSPAQVRKYAHHFIFWRRGIAIPPLHARDVYILSPNADLSLLPRASQAWERAFPLAPRLADFLAELSAAPRPYKWFCPSKNHRPTYLQMLAWLMRGGWVTQLCTFAYVVVWPEILYEVEYELEAEELRLLQAEASKREKDKEKREQAEKDRQSSNSEQHNDEKGKEKETLKQEENPLRGVWEHDFDHRDRRFFNQHRPSSPTGSSSTIRGLGNISLSGSTTTLDRLSASTTNLSTAEGPGLAPSLSSAALHPHQSVTPASPSSPAETASSPSHLHHQNSPPSHHSSEPPSASASPPEETQTQGERFALAARLTRIADKEAQAAYERSAAFARKPPPKATEHPSLNTAAHLSHLSPYVIVDARRATGKDSLYLSAIGRRFADPKVRAAWPVFWKYFNGHAALERIVLGLANSDDGNGNGNAGASGGGGGGGGSGGTDNKLRIKKRKEAWALMTGMSEHLICIRHF